MASVRSLLCLLAVATAVAGSLFVSRPTASAVETVHLASGSVIALVTPPFVEVGKRYAFTWAGGGPAQTYTVKSKRSDGWILVDVADENTNPAHYTPGQLPTRWLNIATAISIQEMRPHLY